ncbi:MAG: hypothetical protein ACXWE3_01185 [Methylobacter sp.]
MKRRIYTPMIPRDQSRAANVGDWRKNSSPLDVMSSGADELLGKQACLSLNNWTESGINPRL